MDKKLSNRKGGAKNHMVELYELNFVDLLYDNSDDGNDKEETNDEPNEDSDDEKDE